MSDKPRNADGTEPATKEQASSALSSEPQNAPSNTASSPDDAPAFELAGPFAGALARWTGGSRRKDRALRAGLGILTGVLLSLASPDVSWFAASFVAWIPMLLAIAGRRWPAALGYGTLAGFTAVFISYGWMVELTMRFGGLPAYGAWMVHGVFSLAHGLQWGLTALLAYLLSFRTPSRVPWLFALAWPIGEIFFPALFPVNGGFFWAQYPSWLQAAELVGAPGVAGLHVLCNVLILRAVCAPPTLRIRRAAVAAGVLAAIPLLGRWRMSQLDARYAALDSLQVGVVQGNAGIVTRRDKRVQVLQSLQQASAALEQQGAELLVWGETVYPFRGFFRDTTHDFPTHDLRRVMRNFSTDLLFGLTTYDPGGNWRRPYNTAWILNSEGEFGERYDKAKPLWFGEYVPLVDPDWYLDTFPNASYLNRGPGPQVMRWKQLRLGPMICYEILLADYVRETVDLGVNILVNMTNDSWFGATREQGEHLALTVVRAVETRRPLIRAVSAGVSAYIDPNGRIIDSLARTDSDRDGFKGAQGFLVQVPIVDTQDRTLYLRVGWAWRLIYPLAALGLAFALHRRSLREERRA